MKINKKVSVEIQEILRDDSSKPTRDHDPSTSDVDELLVELEALARVVDHTCAFERGRAFPVTCDN